MGPPQLAHMASAEAVAAAEFIAGFERDEIDRSNIPSCTYCQPQVASVGLSEKACREANIPYLRASYPFDDLGKSMCLGELYGHVKLLCDPRSGELIGAHIVGPEAGELIHELATVMYFHGTVRDLEQIPHYHPTLAEIITYPAEELAEQL